MSYDVTFVKQGDYIRVSVYCDDGRARPLTGQKHGGLPLNELPRNIQRVLDRIKLRVEEYTALQQQAGKSILKKEIDRTVKEAIGKKVSVKSLTTGAILERYMTEAKAGKVLNNRGKKYAPNSLDLMQFAVDAAQEDALYKIPIQELKTSHLDNFRATLSSKGHGNKRGYTANTIKIYNNILASIISRSFKLDWHETDLTKQKGRLWASGEDVDYAIHYNEQELKKLYNTEFEDKALNRVRDVFILGCYTCLRHSDYYITDYELAVKNDILKIRFKKTDKIVDVPLHPVAKEILDKYDSALPKLDYEALRRGLKRMCKIAGYDEPCLFSRTENGETVQEYKPKWQLTTPHTMRRSFATNAFIKGMPERMIMRIGGWKTYSSFERYLRLSGLDIAELAMKQPFYKDWGW